MSDITPANPSGKGNDKPDKPGKPTDPQPSPDQPGNGPKLVRPTKQGDRRPSANVAKDILAGKRKSPGEIKMPASPPPGYDRMNEIAKANTQSGKAQAFSAGMPSDWQPVNPAEDVTEEG